jgi:hypothetical protein
VEKGYISNELPYLRYLVEAIAALFDDTQALKSSVHEMNAKGLFKIIHVK